MKSLKDLTPEIEAKIPSYIQEGLVGVFDGGRYNSFDYEKAVAAVNWNYEFCGYNKPLVLVAENPFEQQLYFNYLVQSKEHAQLIALLWAALNNEPVKDSELSSKLDSELSSKLDSKLSSKLYSELRSKLYSELDSKLDSFNSTYLYTLNVCSDAYYQWYKFIKEEFNLALSITETFESCFKLQRESNIYSAIFSEAVCVVCKYPKRVHRNADDEMHCLQDVAVEWGAYCDETDFKCYYINGRSMPEKIFSAFTKQDFLA